MTLPTPPESPIDKVVLRLKLPEAFNVRIPNQALSLTNGANQQVDVYMSSNYKDLYILFGHGFVLPKYVAHKSETIMGEDQRNIVKTFSVQISPYEEPIVFVEKRFANIDINLVFLLSTPLIDFRTYNPGAIHYIKSNNKIDAIDSNNVHVYITTRADTFYKLFENLVVPNEREDARFSIKDFDFPLSAQIFSGTFPIFNLIETIRIPSPEISRLSIPRTTRELFRLEPLPPRRENQPKSSFKGFDDKEEPFHKKPK